MTSRLAGRLIPQVLAFLVLSCLLAEVQARQNEECPLGASEYANRGYKVREIRVDVPLQVFSQVAESVGDIRAQLAVAGNYENPIARAHPLRVKEPFNEASWSEGARIVRKAFDADSATTQRLRFTLVFPVLRACREKDASLGDPEGEPTLAVEYRVYTSEYLSYLSAVYEGRSQGLSRSFLLTPLTKFLSRTSPQPYVGFNRSRSFFGGGRFAFRRENPLFTRIDVDASGSSSSAEVSLNARGSKAFAGKALAHAEWLGGYSYSNIPSAPMALQEGRATGQFIGATAPLGKWNWILRYGTAFQAGNKQTDLAPESLPPGILSGSAFSSVKFFGGAALRAGPSSFAASYGIEIGATDSGRRVDYVKQVFDVKYARRFLPRPHRTVTVETSFAAGDLDTRGPVPLGVRFFGGNAEKNFVAGEDWVIVSNPFIRSIPQNQFVPARPGPLIGGDRFLAFNVTVAPVIWGRPLVPEQLLDDPTFAPSVQGAFLNVENLTFSSNLAESTPVASFADSLLMLDESAAGPAASPLGIILATLEQFESESSGDQEAEATLAEARSAVEDMRRRLASLRTELDKKGSVILELQRVAKDFTSCTDFSKTVFPDVSSSLHILAVRLNAVMQLLDNKGISPTDPRRLRIMAQKAAVDAVHRAAPCKYALLVSQDVECSCRDAGLDEETKELFRKAQAAARKRAEATIAPAREIFGRLTRELNLVAVSPLLLFDAARIRSTFSVPERTATRYGIGGGIRLTIVSLDVDLGYAFNVGRDSGERRGAVFFSFRINDLLR